MKKKIFITGSDGFIGRNLREQFQDNFELFTPNSKELDLLDSQKVEKYLDKYRFDAVVHCATHNATAVGNKDLSLVLHNNLMMFYTLVRSQKLFGKMFYFGSGAEYDLRFYKPKMKEEYFDVHVPVDNYGFSKYIMCKFAQRCDRVYDLRVFGCFGKYEDWRIRFISNAICMAIYDLDIAMQQNVYFDYLYVNDLAKIIRNLINLDKINFHEFNVCTGQTIDLMTLAQKIIMVSGKKIGIRVAKKGLKSEYSGDNTRLLKILPNFKFTPIEEAIRELYDWYLNNKKLINKDLLSPG